MRGVLQDHPETCVQAAIASLLELPLEQVPRFDARNWGLELAEWLSRLGFGMLNCTLNDASPPDTPNGYTLCAMPSTHRPGWLHCVVCYNGKVIWCPLEGEQPGTENAREYTILYPLDPRL